MGGDYSSGPSEWQYNGDSGYYAPAAEAPAPVDAGAVVEQMYQEILGRAPDPGGYEAFVNAVNSGADIAALAQSMASSQEAQNRGITEQAQQVVNNIAADTNAYVQQVQTKQYNNDYVDSLYYSILGRAPDAQGRADNLAALNNGSVSPEQLAASFAASKEAQTNNISNAQEQQIASVISGSYGQTGSHSIDTASGNWSGVTPAQLAKAGITNPAILTAAAMGTLNDNIFGAYKTDANVVANALNSGQKVPTDTASTLNKAAAITGAPSGAVVSKTADASGGVVYHYANGGTVLYDRSGNPVSISLGLDAYRQASKSGDGASMAVADNPGTAMFNGRVVTVSAPHLQWNPSSNQVQTVSTGIPMSYREPSSGGFGADLAKFDKTVSDTIPGGWGTVAAVALAIATYGASAGITEGAMVAADAAGLAGQGLSAAQIAEVLGTSYGMTAEAAAAAASAATGAVATSVAGGAIEGISAEMIAASQQGVAEGIAASGTGTLSAGTTGSFLPATTAAQTGAYTGVMGPGVAQTLTGAMTYGALSSSGMNALMQLAQGGNIDLSKVLTAGVTGAITGGVANQFLDPALTLTAALKNGALTGVGSTVVNSLLTGQPITAQSLAMAAALGATINGIANQITLPNGAIRQYFADGSTSTIDPATGRISLTDSTLQPGQAVQVAGANGETIYYTQGTNGPQIYNVDGSLNTQYASDMTINEGPGGAGGQQGPGGAGGQQGSSGVELKPSMYDIKSTGISDSAPGTIFTGPDGQQEIVLNGGKTVDLTTYQLALTTYPNVSVDGMIDTSDVNVGRIPKTTYYTDPATGEQRLAPDDTSTSTSGVQPGTTSSNASATDIPTPEQLQFELQTGTISQAEYEQAIQQIKSGTFLSGTPGAGSGGFGVTTPVVPPIFNPTTNTVPGTNIPVTTPIAPTTPGTGTTPGQGPGSGTTGTGTGAGQVAGPVAPGTGTQPGTGVGSQTGTAPGTTPGTGNGGIAPGNGQGSGGGTGIGSGGTGGIGNGQGSGGGGTGGLGSGGGTGGLGSGGGGGGLGSGGGAGGSGPGVVIPPKPATPATQTPIPPKVTLPNLTGGLANPGLNPGWMNQGVQPMYATTSPVQSQYYWGGHPYMPDYASLQNYNNVPSAPVTPWGLQQMSAPLTSYLPQGYGGTAPVAPPLQQSAYKAVQAPIMPQPNYGIPKV